MRVGLDIGSTTIKCVVLDENDTLLYSTYERHYSHILEKAQELLRRIDAVMEDEDTFCSPEFSLAVLARLSESNTNYVSQVINTTYNNNFRTFLNERRIKVAMKRMMDSGRYGATRMQ